MRTKSLPLGIALLFWFSGVAGANSLFGYDIYGGTWSDANKTDPNTEDDLMCWAAATSNVLAYTGWGYPQSATFTGSNDIFAYYQNHWTDKGGNIVYGVDWWFSGINGKQGNSGWSQVDVAGGGFYTTLKSDDYALWSSEDEYALVNTAYLLAYGYGVGLSLGGPSGHAVTAWGFEYDSQGNYLGLYITDSDDGATGLKYYNVLFNSSNEQWFLQNYYGYNTYFIAEVYGLQIKANSEPVPEPATMILFGAGIAGLVASRRRKKAC
jgi:hypothetical protein